MKIKHKTKDKLENIDIVFRIPFLIKFTLTFSIVMSLSILYKIVINIFMGENFISEFILFTGMFCLVYTSIRAIKDWKMYVNAYINKYKL